MKVRIIIIILLIIIALFVVIVAAGGIGAGGNKVTVMGTVYYSMWPGPGWGVTFDDYFVEEDGILSLLWYMPWETKDIEVKVELSNGKDYISSTWTDKLNLVLGSTSFSIDIRHVPEGSYSGRIYVYEVEKQFIFGEKNRVLQATTSFEVNV